MRLYRILSIAIVVFSCLVILPQYSCVAQSLKERNEALLQQIQQVHGLSDKQMNSVRAIFRESGYIGQGNPAVAEHPVTPGG